jgi:phosphatidylserine/phosphatidylglycerophosphate/cardiolipin synthase-like enzyme
MPPIAIHGKMVLVDDNLSIIHSSNFNIRSTYYNTEAGVAVLDRELNRELTELLAGLIEFRDGPKQCVGGSGIEDIPDLMLLLGPDDLPQMREELGGKQPFLDAWGVAW